MCNKPGDPRTIYILRNLKVNPSLRKTARQRLHLWRCIMDAWCQPSITPIMVNVVVHALNKESTLTSWIVTCVYIIYQLMLYTIGGTRNTWWCPSQTSLVFHKLTSYCVEFLHALSMHTNIAHVVNQLDAMTIYTYDMFSQTELYEITHVDCVSSTAQPSCACHFVSDSNRNIVNL